MSNQNKTSKLFHMYVMTKFLPAWHSSKKRVFLNDIMKVKAHLITLFLATFASKLVNNLSDTDSLKTPLKSTFRFLTLSKQNPMDHYGSNFSPMWTKRYQKKRYCMGFKFFLSFFSIKEKNCECQPIKNSVITDYEVLWIVYFGWICSLYISYVIA